MRSWAIVWCSLSLRFRCYKQGCKMSEDSKLLRLVDVGALGGIQNKWKPHLQAIWPIMFEPNPTSAQQLRILMKDFKKCTVIERALANVDAKLPLYVTKNPTCVSLLQPNDILLQHYGLRVHFEVIQKLDVSCARYDTLFAANEVPRPDVIKLDTQGFEFQILLGFGGLLQGCLGVELEAHIYALYREQKLFHELVSLLETFGLILHKLSPKLTGFDGNIVEVNAFFLRRQTEVRGLDDAQRSKLKLLTEAWRDD
jgi:FkbM family methyltransferase